MPSHGNGLEIHTTQVTTTNPENYFQNDE